MFAWQPSIPGIDLDPDGDQRMKRAIVASMAALDGAGRLSPADAAAVQLLVIMAERVDIAAGIGKITVAAVTERSGTYDKLHEFVQDHALTTADAAAAWETILADLQGDDLPATTEASR